MSRHRTDGRSGRRRVDGRLPGRGQPRAGRHPRPDCFRTTTSGHRACRLSSTSARTHAAVRRPHLDHVSSVCSARISVQAQPRLLPRQSGWWFHQGPHPLALKTHPSNQPFPRWVPRATVNDILALGAPAMAQGLDSRRQTTFRRPVEKRKSCNARLPLPRLDAAIAPSPSSRQSENTSATRFIHPLHESCPPAAGNRKGNSQ